MRYPDASTAPRESDPSGLLHQAYEGVLDRSMVQQATTATPLSPVASITCILFRKTSVIIVGEFLKQRSDGKPMMEAVSDE